MQFLSLYFAWSIPWEETRAMTEPLSTQLHHKVMFCLHKWSAGYLAEWTETPNQVAERADLAPKTEMRDPVLGLYSVGTRY